MVLKKTARTLPASPSTFFVPRDPMYFGSRFLLQKMRRTMLQYETMDNTSPWIIGLNQSRNIHAVHSDRVTDIAIVGNDIAPIVTAYFVLKHTPLEIILLLDQSNEEESVLYSHYDASLTKHLRTHGIPAAHRFMKTLSSAWQILKNIHKEHHLKTPIESTPENSTQEFIQARAFSEELLHALANQYADRLSISETTPIRSIAILPHETRLFTAQNITTAAKTIICTREPHGIPLSCDDKTCATQPHETTPTYSPWHTAQKDRFHQRILYNTGAQDARLLASVIGGYQVAKILNGEPLETDIFS